MAYLIIVVGLIVFCLDGAVTVETDTSNSSPASTHKEETSTKIENKVHIAQCTDVPTIKHMDTLNKAVHKKDKDIFDNEESYRHYLQNRHNIEKDMDDDTKELKNTLDGMTKQIMKQQIYTEERIRNNGNSGVVRQENLQDNFEIMGSERNIGIGENTYVMNGVEFRNNRNKYRLEMPNTKKGQFHSVEDIPFPNVPPSVKAKQTVQEQIEEMKMYFKAFKFKDSQLRSDYRKYFQPLLCYVEGAWLQESYDEQKQQYIDNNNLQFHAQGMYTQWQMPAANRHATIIDVKNSTPVFAFWHHRTLCHPIRKDIALDDFYPKDDLALRIAKQKTDSKFGYAAAVRFGLKKEHIGRINLEHSNKKDKHQLDSLVDYLMAEIPGKDNYQGSKTITSFNIQDKDERSTFDTKVKTKYYHRMYKVRENVQRPKGHIRVYPDKNLFVAHTIQDKVVPLSLEECGYIPSTDMEECHTFWTRFSYALPLEVVWLTPLLKWNPYNLTFHKSKVDNITPVKVDGRDGTTLQKALNGTDTNNYIITPTKFFKSHHNTYYVLDKHGTAQKVSPTMTYIILPEIEGLGRIRTRYPIMPVHQEENELYRELDAVKELVMNIKEKLGILGKK